MISTTFRIVRLVALLVIAFVGISSLSLVQATSAEGKATPPALVITGKVVNKCVQADGDYTVQWTIVANAPVMSYYDGTTIRVVNSSFAKGDKQVLEASYPATTKEVTATVVAYGGPLSSQKAFTSKVVKRPKLCPEATATPTDDPTTADTADDASSSDETPSASPATVTVTVTHEPSIVEAQQAQNHPGESILVVIVAVIVLVALLILLFVWLNTRKLPHDRQGRRR